MKRKVVLTYGTFDLFHIGHLNLLRRLREFGDYLIVGVSTDEFNSLKGKKTIIPYADRAAIVGAVRYVDAVIPEHSWEQKADDIRSHEADVFGMGHDWTGKFDHLRSVCDVVYLPRTEAVSSTELKRVLNVLDRSHVQELKQALDLISSIVTRFE